MINIAEYGFIQQEALSEGYLPARITTVHRDRYEAVCGHGIVSARLKGSASYNKQVFPTVGDYVELLYNPNGESLITSTLERKSKFARSNFSGHAEGYVKTVLEQVVAANFDYVFIIASLNRDFSLERIERYLALAWQSGGIPVVVLTKADLVPDFTRQLTSVRAVAAGAEVFAVSVVTGIGRDRLDEYQKPGKTIVFLGSSGVGKSSLVNFLAGEKVMQTRDIRENDSKGRHTTTHRQLIKLKSGLLIIDTPGMRELGMWEGAAGLESAFADIESYFASCKFRDCRHRNEPGCAVKEALASGQISQRRWQSYQELNREVRFADRKSPKGKDEHNAKVDRRFKDNDD